MQYQDDSINFGELIKEYNRRKSKEWIEIDQRLERKRLDQMNLIREAYEHLNTKEKEMLRKPKIPEGLEVLGLLERIMLEIAKGMAGAPPGSLNKYEFRFKKKRRL